MSKTYYAKLEGFIAGKFRKVGEPFSLTPAEAKYPVMAGLVSDTPPRVEEPSPPPAEPDTAPPSRKTR